MHDLTGKIAVVTGGASGIGRSLVRRLAQQGCRIATCDIRGTELLETRRLALEGAPQGAAVAIFEADVSQEAQVMAFRDEVTARLETDHVHIVFNNAGVGGGGSFVADPRSAWERTFNVCWGGVYLTARAFLPLLVAAEEAVLVNVSSVNGFWATLGPQTTHTAYSAAKFAVKGFTEALIGDLRLHAPHVTVRLVMPGHIGTSIAHNTIAEAALEMDSAAHRDMMERADAFRSGGMSPDRAAELILEGVRGRRWRILVGPDAYALDEAVRATPDTAYELAFYNTLAELAVGKPS